MFVHISSMSVADASVVGAALLTISFCRCALLEREMDVRRWPLVMQYRDAEANEHHSAAPLCLSRTAEWKVSDIL
jgi:hypothetical protein